MTTDKTIVQNLAREQLDRRLDRLRRALSDLRPPRGGWTVTLRSALGMSQADLARRMGVTRQAISHLEHREAEGSATLKALKTAAEALGGELVYAIVPERPLNEMLERRADHVARRMLTSIRHTMRLEDQEPDVDLDTRVRQLARELLASPGDLWTEPDGG